MAQKLELKKNVSIRNKKASFEYELLDRYTAGIVLKGTEIKSIRMQKVSLQDAFCLFLGEELYVRGMNISPYTHAGFQNHEAKADRKLLLSKQELRKIKGKLEEKGLTVVPTFLFVNDRGLAKLEVALARGKKLHDKRHSIKEKDIKREMARS